jgi:hypothetical protein
MPVATLVRARTGVLAAMSVMSLGALSLLPASAGASTAAVAVPLTQSAALRLAAASPAVGVPAGSTLEEVKCVVLHVTPNGHERSVHCAEVWFLSDGGESQVTAGNDVYCQSLINGDPLSDCDVIEEEVQLRSPQFPTRTQVQSGECGTIIGHSDCGARTVTNATTPIRVDIFDTGMCSFTATSIDSAETSDDTTAAGTVTTPAFSVAC